MTYPLISEYISSILDAEENFATQRSLRPVLDDYGQPIMSSGNFAVVFKMKDIHTGKLYALKCFTKEQEGRDKAYSVISRGLSYLSTDYMLKVKYLEKELFVDSTNSKNDEFPVVIMDWLEGKNLYDYLLSIYYDPDALSDLAYRFSLLAKWLISQDFAHGDIKPENIIVNSKGQLTIIDYDGMFFPSMDGQSFRENGTPLYRNPFDTNEVYDRNIDDFALASLCLSLYMISVSPDTYYDYFNGDVLLWKMEDISDIGNSEVFKSILAYATNSDIAKSFATFLLVLSNKKLNGNFDLFSFEIPEKEFPGEEEWEWYAINSMYKTSRQLLLDSDRFVKCSLDEKWDENFDVIYSRDGKVLKRYYLNKKVRTYIVKDGTEEILDNSFDGFDDYDYGYDDNDLYSLVLPSSLHIVSEETFSKSPIQYLFVPNGTKSKFCALLPGLSEKIVELPNGVCLTDKSVLTTIATIEDIKEGILDEYGVVYSKDYSCLLRATKHLGAYEIKEGTMTICDGAFPYGVESLKIPDSIILMGKFALFNTSPSNVVYEGQSKDIAELVKAIMFVNPQQFVSIKNSRGPYYSIDGKAFLNYGDNHYLYDEYELKQGTEAICNESFNDLFDEIDCYYVDKITIPSSVKYIGKNVFNQGLQNIECNSLHFKVLDYALYSSDGKILYRYFGNEEEVNIPDSVEVIMGGAFSGYLNYKEIIFPRYLKHIGDNPFAGYISKDKALKVNCYFSNFRVHNNALYDEENKILVAYWGTEEQFDILDGTKYIGANAFAHSNIQALTVPESLTGIDVNAFMYALNLVKIDARTTSATEANRLSQIFKRFNKWSYTFVDEENETDKENLPF